MENELEKQYINSIYEGTKYDFDFYNKFINITKKGKVLDLGCGVGSVSNYLSDFGYECIGYDIDEYHIKMAKKYKSNLNLCVGDIKNIPFQETKATGAVYAYCLHCLKDEEIIQSFKSCNKNLTDEGTILILTTCKMDIMPSFYVNILNGQKIILFLEQAGFKVKVFKYFNDNYSICVIATKYKNI